MHVHALAQACPTKSCIPLVNFCITSLAASPSPPDRSRTYVAEQHVVGGAAYTRDYLGREGLVTGLHGSILTRPIYTESHPKPGIPVSMQIVGIIIPAIPDVDIHSAHQLQYVWSVVKCTLCPLWLSAWKYWTVHASREATSLLFS